MMPQSEFESTQPAFSSRLGGFLKRLLLAFIKLGLVFLALAALAGVAWLIYQEIDRSFDSVTKRVDFNGGRINEVEKELVALSAAGDLREEQDEILQTAIADQATVIADLENDLDAELKQQAEDLANLEERVTVLVASTDTISGHLSVLNEGLVALQLDITTNVSDIDAVGGEVDALQSDLAILFSDVEAVQTELSDYSADEFNRMRQSLALFRVWEMVSRARLRLIEQNVGLAVADIDTALASVDRLLVIYSQEEDAATADLEQVQQRLTLAAAGLPDDPAAAARDLETAWQLLDASLAALFGEQAAEPVSP